MTMKVGINKVFFIDKVLVCRIVPVKIIKVDRDLPYRKHTGQKIV